VPSTKVSRLTHQRQIGGTPQKRIRDRASDDLRRLDLSVVERVHVHHGVVETFDPPPLTF
jgi:hypothetical protein